MSKKKLLVITSRFPFPVVGGERLRIYKVCEELSNNFDITLLSLCEAKDELHFDVGDDKVFKEIKVVYHPRWKSYFNCICAFFSKKPLQVAYYQSNDFSKLVTDVVDDFDFVLCHLIRMSDYVKDVNKPKVLEMTDAISLNYSRVRDKLGWSSIMGVIYGFEYSRTLRYEQSITKKFDKSFLVSDVDFSYLVENGVERELLGISSNGVDDALFKFDYNPDKRTIIFIGNMTSVQNYDAAVWFASSVMPLLLKHGDYIFKIVGRIGEKKKLQLEKFSNVVVTGSVNSIIDSCDGAFVGVCPVRIGAGVQNKVLEYMALGIPAITSTVGLEGIGAIPGYNILTSDTPEQYVETILSLLSHDYASQIGLQGRQYVMTNHVWSSKVEPITKFLTMR
ncbi:glycosyltransferase family 4 protein [Shewanella chilikensis]|uniref:glycosyltransferase family 4 protein n=1 Tax=Shewanella chilikensis TaxID=558541 RepID=UPI0030CF6931